MSWIGIGGVTPWGLSSYSSRIRRLLLLAAGVCVVLLLGSAGTALAETPGSLSQLARPNDCYQQSAEAVVTECGSGGADGSGLRGTRDVVVSPDGQNVYVLATNDSSIAEFARNGDGSLSPLPSPNNCIANQAIDTSSGSCGNQVVNGMNAPRAIAISPDGQNVYVVATDNRGIGTIVELSRASDGTLSQPSPNDCIAENAAQNDGSKSTCANQSGHGIESPDAITVSPDGQNVYVADAGNEAVAEFTRNGDGSLSQLNGPNDCIQESGFSAGFGPDCTTSGNGLQRPSSVVVSPDGQNVYVGGSDTIAEFSRAGDGSLTQLTAGNNCVQEHAGEECQNETGAGIPNVFSLAVSPDGRNLYSSSATENGPIAEFVRNSDGSLAVNNGCIEEGGTDCATTDARGLGFGGQLKITPDGANVYVASISDDCNTPCHNDVAEFSRGTSGLLSQLGQPDSCIEEHSDASTDCTGNTGGHGLGGQGLAISPDNASVYVTGPSDIAEFARAPVPTLTVTRSGTGNGSITDDHGTISCPPTCSHAYPPGTQVTLTATPAPGSAFTGWSGGGCSGTGTCTVTMDSDKNVTATFDVVAQPAAASTLTVSKNGSGGGTVTDDKGGISCPPTCSHAYPTGTKVTLTANPANGSSFAGWNGGGCSGTGTCSVTMNSDTNVNATFNALPASGGPGSPSILSNKPAVNGSNGAGFSGAANPEGSTTFVFWQYGLDKRYTKAGGKGPDYTNATPRQQVGSDGSSHSVSTSVQGLLPNALYHVRMIAFNRNGSAIGPDQTFVTPSGPAPGPPTLGRSFDIAPVSGIVFIVIGHRLIPLTADTKIPAGSIIDALHGTVEIFTASGKKGKLYHGFFGGAVFRLTEAVFGADRGLTTLQLVEGTFKGAPSYKSCQAHGAGDRTAHAALSSRILQTLHARATGRFRTRGRYAAGTVRGTQWTTGDRCDGTLLAVQLHSIVVQDFVKQFLLFLPQGHSYLAGPHSPPPPEKQELTEPHNEGGEATGP